MKKAVAIRHIAFEDLGSLAPALEQQGYEVTYVEASMNDLKELTSASVDLLLVLGGPIGANDESDYPFLVDELRLLEHRLAEDLPTIGICLGAQLMARALGARVYTGTGKEIGWEKIELSHFGKQSSLNHLAPEQTLLLHWHGDTFELPTDAIHLASTQKYQNQAFAWKKQCLALQFHPEVTARGLERWIIGHACELSTTPDVSVSKLRQDTACYAEQLERQAGRFWQDWLNSIQDKAVSTVSR